MNVCNSIIQKWIKWFWGDVLQLPEGRDFYRKCLCGAQNFRLPLNCLRSTKPRVLQMCCYSQFFYLFFVNLSSSSYPFFPHQFVSRSVVIVVRHLFRFTFLVKIFYLFNKIYYFDFVLFFRDYNFCF